MEKQSRLDKEGIRYRAEEIPNKNRYEDEINPYDENSKDALAAYSEKEHGLGKGTGKSLGYVKRNLDAPKTEMNYADGISTREEAGGYYDRFGTKGVEKAFQGDSGREWAKQINDYSVNNEYGVDSVDIDTTVRGQFVVD